MGRAEQRTKSAKMAAELIRRGFPHGRRQHNPNPGSGGLNAFKGPGSASYQRRLKREAK